MISLDQVLLLEEKVESAVAKIAQLNAENAALRRKCAELTNALSAKTEQLSSFQSDQNKIEEGILKALNRLDVVENAVLANAASSASSSSVAVEQPAPEISEEEKPLQTGSFEENAVQNSEENQNLDDSSENSLFGTDFDNLSQVASEPVVKKEEASSENSGNFDDSQTASSQSPFDIF